MASLRTSRAATPVSHSTAPAGHAVASAAHVSITALIKDVKDIPKTILEAVQEVEQCIQSELAYTDSLPTTSPRIQPTDWPKIIHCADQTHSACEKLVQEIEKRRPMRDFGESAANVS